MIKKIHEVQSIIDTSPKYNDCLLLPIGLTNGRCNDLSLSCRGRMPNNKAFLKGVIFILVAMKLKS